MKPTTYYAANSPDVITIPCLIEHAYDSPNLAVVFEEAINSHYGFYVKAEISIPAELTPYVSDYGLLVCRRIVSDGDIDVGYSAAPARLHYRSDNGYAYLVLDQETRNWISGASEFSTITCPCKVTKKED